MDEFCGSTFWDSNTTWQTNDPEFTHCFESTVLIWIPCAFLWLFTPLELYYIKTSKYSNIPWNFRNVFRLSITILLTGLITSDLVMNLFLKDIVDFYNFHIITPIIKILTFILTIALGFQHRKRGIMSSGVIFIFWFLLFLLAIPQFRKTIGQYQESEDILWANFRLLSYTIYFLALLIQLLAHCFTDKLPQSSEYNIDGLKTKYSSPEIEAGFLQKIFFIWFESFIWKGFRKPLDTSDVYDLNPQETCDELMVSFQKYWYESVENGRAKRKNRKSSNINAENSNARQTNGSVLPAMVKSFLRPFLSAGFLNLSFELLSFGSPFVLRYMIDFTSSDAPLWHGICYAILLFGISILSGLLEGQFYLRTFLVGMRIKASLISSIYHKALTISPSTRKDKSLGEIVNLMAVDASRFYDLIQYCHFLWTGLITTALATYFLWQILGIAVLSGIMVMILLIPINIYIAYILKLLQAKIMKKKDVRIKLLNEILNGIKVLKFYAWESSFEDAVKKVREEELRLYLKMGYINAIIFYAWTIAPFFVTIATFSTYVLIDANNVLDAQTAFVSLALFNILRNPLALLPMSASYIMQSWVSVNRINNFLNDKDILTENVTHYNDKNAIKIENGTFSWDDNEFFLKDINLSVRKSTLVAIVGSVGAGKSTLISSILGETEKVHGNINIDGSIAYVAQQAWIQNATFKENILFGKAFDQQLYDQIVDACALRPDIAILPAGDQTEIGEKGINLSGGQKQRVSLARAVYNRADIYLLDDPLSAVDSHVGKYIFNQIIGPNGLLSDKTRVLVTHAITYLPQVETIYVFNAGCIAESGHYNNLIEEKGAFADFIVQHLLEIDDEDDEITEIKEILGENNTGHQIFEQAIQTRALSQRRRSSVCSARMSLTMEAKFKISQLRHAKLVQKETSQTGDVDIKIYLNYFKAIGPVFVIATILSCIAYQFFAAYSNIWLSYWTSDNNKNKRNTYLGVFGALGLIQSVALLLNACVIVAGCLLAAKNIHSKLLHQIMRMPISFFDTTPTGRIINRFSADTEVVDNKLPQLFRVCILLLSSAIAVLVIISISTPLFMIIIIPIGIFYYILQKFYTKTLRQLKRIESTTKSPIYSHFGETLSGQSTIRAYNAKTRFIEKSYNLVDINQKVVYLAVIANRWLQIRLQGIASIILLSAGVFAVIERDNIDGSTMGLSISYALTTVNILGFLVRMSAETESNIVANERMEEYANQPIEDAWIKKPVHTRWPNAGEIKFKNYRVRYRPDTELVLRGINFTIRGGEKVGIVGRTGSGKTTLTLCLFRLLEPTGGSITIDGVDISGLGLHSLRSALTIIPQDPVLFCGTLRMNIDPFNTFSDDAIWNALEQSDLTSLVKSTSYGLDYTIGEGGENLSVGQKQLVCLARALLRKTKILVMDEATAAVDLETDAMIQKTIRTKFSDCTILTIAHRLNTILDSDRILVLEDGRIAEFDKPKKLLDNKRSKFYNMAREAGIVA